MPIRSLDILDLPTIARYRNEALALDNARTLTRGHPLGAVGLLAYINPSRHLYSAISNENNKAILGGIIHTRNEPFAKLLYLAPISQLGNPEFPSLIEHLAAQAGEWKANHVLAEIDEDNDAFPSLRKAGFSVYAWQRIWDASLLEKTGAVISGEWKRMQSIDLPAVQNLHYQIVPQLMHPIEPSPNRPIGFVHNNDIKGYASLTSGAYGILLTPLIHPEENDVSSKIVALINSLPDRRGRKVYLCVRSYQAWLEPALEDLGAKASPRQAVMVKHLARLVKKEVPARAVPQNAGIQPSRVSRMETDE